MDFKTSKDFCFFYGQDSIFSNWHPVEFKDFGIEFNCVEQYMMFRKAMLFNNEYYMNKILNEKNPYNQKKLGRKIPGFSQGLWDANKVRIVRQGLKHKFLQNKELERTLRATKDRQMVEANPYDNIWGVGLSIEDTNIYCPEKWEGLNLLGKILTDVRDKIIMGV